MWEKTYPNEGENHGFTRMDTDKIGLRIII